MFRKEISVAILTRKESVEVKDIAVSLISSLYNVGFKVYSNLSQKTHSATMIHSIDDVKQVKPDVLITVGGDGTLLWVLREMNDTTPILGVYVGGRGILSEIRPAYLGKAVQKLHEKQYSIDARERISASVGSTTLNPALNEVYINRVSQTRTSTYTISIGNYAVKQRMDGLMVSTSTGSTGHSLSFGGPYIHPGSDVFLLMMVGSISRFPPIILPIEPIEIISDHDSIVTIDGQEDFLVKASERIMIKKHIYDAHFIRFEDKRFQQLEKVFL